MNNDRTVSRDDFRKDPMKYLQLAKEGAVSVVTDNGTVCMVFDLSLPVEVIEVVGREQQRHRAPRRRTSHLTELQHELATQEGDRLLVNRRDLQVLLHDASPRLDLQRRRMTQCQSDDDGDCSWPGCPQLRDGEPAASGRHCPLDADREDP